MNEPHHASPRDVNFSSTYISQASVIWFRDATSLTFRSHCFPFIAEIYWIRFWSLSKCAMFFHLLDNLNKSLSSIPYDQIYGHYCSIVLLVCYCLFYSIYIISLFTNHNHNFLTYYYIIYLYVFVSLSTSMISLSLFIWRWLSMILSLFLTHLLFYSHSIVELNIISYFISSIFYIIFLFVFSIISL